MRRIPAFMMVGLLAIATAACGSDDDDTSDTTAATTATTAAGTPTSEGGATTVAGGGAGPEADAAKAAAIVAPSLQPITDIGVDVPLTEKPPTGKKVAWIGGGLQSTQVITPGFRAATEALGWELVIVDYDQSDPQSVNSAVQAAVDQSVDYIAISGTDITAFEQAADAAKSANIPIIDMFSSNEATGADGNGIYTVISNADATRSLAALLSNFVIADSGGTGHVAFVNLPEFPILQVGAQSAKDTYAANCAECTFDELDVTIADLTGGGVPGLVASYLQQHPDVNYLSFAIGDLFGGVPEALDTAGLAGKVTIVGGVPNVEQVQTLIDGESKAWAVLPREEAAWHAVDAMARLSVEQDLDAITGELVTPIWTADNVPKPASDYKGAEGFEDAFKVLWKL